VISTRPRGSGTVPERQQDLDPKTTYFAGSSVHFDIAFLKVHAPELLRFASYRLLDVSALKVLAAAWGVPGPNGGQPARVAHQPLKDLEGSMAELRHWVAEFNMRRVPEGVL
jgi:oligoribonuclease (3'-5' exoribonuclease)